MEKLLRIELDKPNRFLSNYAIEIFNSCPRKWAYQYIEKLDAKFEDTAAMVRGKTIAEMLEIPKEKWVLEEQIKEIESQFNEEELLIRNDSLDTQLLYLSAVEKYHEEVKHTATVKELTFFDEETQLTGRVDGIHIKDDGQWLIQEDKTTTWKEPLILYFYKYKAQTAIYSMCKKSIGNIALVNPKDLVGINFNILQMKELKKKYSKKRKDPEPPESSREYVKRMKEEHTMIIDYDQVKEDHINETIKMINSVKLRINAWKGDVYKYPKIQRIGTCKDNFGLCPYFEHCHGEELMQKELSNDVTL